MAVDYVLAKVPLVGEVLSTILQMSTFGVLCFCLIILIIYANSALFVFATSIIVHGFGINSSSEVCEGGILLCLVCYMTTKILIYYFLVERAVKLMNHSRITYINPHGVCIIGMQKIAMLPLITFEVVVNVYLTLLFILPLRSLHSYKTNSNPALNRMAFRSFVGSCATLTTSVVNLTVLMVLKGEPGWICLMCCNADILFCVLVLHWVSNKEQKEDESAFRSYTRDGNNGVNAGGIGPAGTVGSNCSRKASVHAFANEQDHEHTLTHHPSDPSLHSLETALHIPATIVTECKASPPPSGIKRVLHRRRSSWDEAPRPGVREAEVELHNIRVQTVQTREVEGKKSESASSVGYVDDETDRGEAGCRAVVGERMV
ncbi:hypothetical protein EK21DRAFT_59092 [Setomelanomma holmii]|uniref:Uncharacterized protein n=1 Tax=Setomelanomma holmii TaxID=210430 RepID=A0A9P4LRY1_9PLEO|nr:hypothetical protein EK21DRAFT_59092 [Setomelanomma holmii]